MSWKAATTTTLSKNSVTPIYKNIWRPNIYWRKSRLSLFSLKYV